MHSCKFRVTLRSLSRRYVQSLAKSAHRTSKLPKQPEMFNACIVSDSKFIQRRRTHIHMNKTSVCTVRLKTSRGTNGTSITNRHKHKQSSDMISQFLCLLSSSFPTVVFFSQKRLYLTQWLYITAKKKKKQKYNINP